MRKPLVEMPKNMKMNCPAKVKTIRMMTAVIVARLTMKRRLSSLSPCVMVRNTGMVPNGLANVKIDVRHNNAYGSNVSIELKKVFNFIFIIACKDNASRAKCKIKASETSFYFQLPFGDLTIPRRRLSYPKIVQVERM